MAKHNGNLNENYSIAKLLLLCLIFHVIYLRSVFDCYFTSPVVHGMQSYGTGNGAAPAKRLMLIVGDGLRADLLFNLDAFPEIENSTEITAPHLRDIATRRGAFGISHTRVPTESRPGHVAIIGGMYEDVSAVTKGWKSNPLDFDSVFNRSSTTFSFGSPDILPMFANGATPGKVKTWCYNEDEEDFTKDATALDVWSLEQLKTLFRNSTTDSHLREELFQNKIIFFLHLLGLDTTGHSYRPHSKEYMNNIRIVDNIVLETENLLEEFYGDRDTAYIFTSDHGMSEIGNHGDGHPDNTRTPLIVWGSGVRGPHPDASHSSHDEYSKPWGLSHLYRRDVEQADIAPLMAALIGINWPVNSAGVLPDVDTTQPGYLNIGEDAKARAALINAKVILEQYRVKHEIKKHFTLFYKPYTPLADITSTDDSPQIVRIQQYLDEKRWTAASDASLKLIQQSLSGLHYLQTYDRFLIKVIVTSAYTGWIAFASLHVFRPRDIIPPSYFTSSPATSLVKAFSGIVLLVFWGLFALQRSPFIFYAYIVFPCYFWQQFLVQIIPLLTFKVHNKKMHHGCWRHVFEGGVVIASLLGMVAAYTHRSIWSVGFVLIGILWPLTWNKALLSNNGKQVMVWGLLCLVTAIFPLLSVNKTESLPSILVGGHVMMVIGIFLALIVDKGLSRLFFCQTGLIFVTMIVTASSVRNLQAKTGLPLINRVLGWTVLVVSGSLPFIYRSHEHSKLSKTIMYFLGFSPLFIILSISVEGLFYVSFTLTLLSWVQIESIVRANRTALEREKHSKKDDHRRSESISRSLTYDFQLDDLRIALFFLFFVQVGFFGTGNVASISSFYLAPVYRLIPVFHPFYMSALLVFKIIAPYVILSVIFAYLNDSLHLPPFSLLLVALTLTDGMSLTFFYMVQDTGSWLEIGQSITFFCVSSTLVLWSAAICAVGEYLMSDVV